MNRLQDRTAIIWGGAGSIGTATARRFTGEGATVYLAGRTEDTLRDATTKKSPVTTQIAATAAFLASDDAAPITATWINATAGMFPS